MGFWTDVIVPAQQDVRNMQNSWEQGYQRQMEALRASEQATREMQEVAARHNLERKLGL